MIAKRYLFRQRQCLRVAMRVNQTETDAGPRYETTDPGRPVAVLVRSQR